MIQVNFNINVFGACLQVRITKIIASRISQSYYMPVNPIMTFQVGPVPEIYYTIRNYLL